MQAHTAGKAKGRYLCPITGWIFTLGLSYSMQLTEPMRLVFVPGWDNDQREPDPDRPGWLRPVRYRRTEPRDSEQAYLDRAAGRVYGPGCAVSRDFTRPGPGSDWHEHADVYLVPAPDADPAQWFVNEPVTYRKCSACSSRFVVSDQTVMPVEWEPRRMFYYRGRRDYHGTPTKPGPHPAGTYACRGCDPRVIDPEPF